jgi:hypothetical protein
MRTHAHKRDYPLLYTPTRPLAAGTLPHANVHEIRTIAEMLTTALLKLISRSWDEFLCFVLLVRRRFFLNDLMIILSCFVWNAWHLIWISTKAVNCISKELWFWHSLFQSDLVTPWTPAFLGPWMVVSEQVYNLTSMPNGINWSFDLSSSFRTRIFEVWILEGQS